MGSTDYDPDMERFQRMAEQDNPNFLLDCVKSLEHGSQVMRNQVDVIREAKRSEQVDRPFIKSLGKATLLASGATLITVHERYREFTEAKYFIAAFAIAVPFALSRHIKRGFDYFTYVRPAKKRAKLVGSWHMQAKTRAIEMDLLQIEEPN